MFCCNEEKIRFSLSHFIYYALFRILITFIDKLSGVIIFTEQVQTCH